MTSKTFDAAARAASAGEYQARTFPDRGVADAIADALRREPYLAGYGSQIRAGWLAARTAVLVQLLATEGRS